MTLGLGSIDISLNITGTIKLGSGAAPAESLGVEKLTNGDMGSATGWSLSGGDNGLPPVISGGKMTFNVAETDPAAARALTGLVTGHTYRITVVVDSLSVGNFNPNISFATPSTPLGQITSAGTFTATFAGSNSIVDFSVSPGGATNAVIDSISIKEVL